VGLHSFLTSALLTGNAEVYKQAALLLRAEYRRLCATKRVDSSSGLAFLKEKNIRLCVTSDEDLYLVQLVNIFYTS